MADQKISQLPSTTTIENADFLTSVQAGNNVKFTGSVLYDSIGWKRTGGDVATSPTALNINLATAGLKDSNVITPVLLGDALNTSLTTTNQTLIGAINEVNASSGTSDFANLTDVTGAYTTPFALYAVNATTNGLQESTTTLTEPALNQFQIQRGTTSILAQANLTISGISAINQDLQISASPQFLGLTLSGLADGLVRSNLGVLSGGGIVSLLSEVTGTLPIGNGGTNSATALLNDKVMISSAGSIIESPLITTSELNLLSGFTSVSQGTLNNDKLVTQGYVDDGITATIPVATKELLTISSSGQTAFTLSGTPSGDASFYLVLNGINYSIEGVHYTRSGTALTWLDPDGITLQTTDSFQAVYNTNGVGGIIVQKDFNATFNGELGEHAVSVVPSNGAQYLEFNTPDDFGTLISLKIYYTPSVGAAGPNKNIDIYSNYAPYGQIYNFYAEQDTTSVYDLTGQQNLINSFEISGLYTNLGASMQCGFHFDSNQAGGNIYIYRIELIYRTIL